MRNITSAAVMQAEQSAKDAVMHIDSAFEHLGNLSAQTSNALAALTKKELRTLRSQALVLRDNLNSLRVSLES